jgi:hypothetical protein
VEVGRQEDRAEEEWAGRSFQGADRREGQAGQEGLRRNQDSEGRVGRTVRDYSLGHRDVGGTTGPPPRA